MSNYDIAISGLDAAQRAIDLIGNNIANAATDGYHRQRIEFSPVQSAQESAISSGRGVDVTGITRLINTLLEQEILRQKSTLGQISQESSTLRTIENAFGELSGEDGGLNAAIEEFFNSLQDLSANPADPIWQNQIVSDAETMASQFRTIGEFLSSLDTQIKLEAENTVGSINTLTSQIAELNSQISKIEIQGNNANSLRDQRDQCILKLSELIGVQTLSRDYGVVDVSAGGIPLVIGTYVNQLEAGLDTNGDLGLSIVGTSNYTVGVQGGKIGGLLSLKNVFVSDISDDLNSLANAIIQKINQYHVQGVGSEGSFTELTSNSNASGDLSDFSTVTDGDIYIRVTNTSTGAVTRTEIPVLKDAASDTLAEIAGFIDGVDVANVSASVNSSNQLTITADAGYKYDFLPAVLSEPTAKTLTGADIPDIAVSGIYTGSSNDTLTFTVSCSGTDPYNIGVDTLTLTVKDIALNVIDTISIGSGYAAGDKIDVGTTGIEVAFSVGDLDDGNSFSIDVFGNTDTSGLLSAVGINTFFFGSNATDIAVCSEISANPKRVATALGADMTDNTNAIRMADVRDETIVSLDSLTCGNFYRRLITNIGQQLSVKQMRQEDIEVMVLNLENQQSETSGVSINDEATQLLIFEQMFQAMARYMNAINETMSSLMDVV